MSSMEIIFGSQGKGVDTQSVTEARGRVADGLFGGFARAYQRKDITVVTVPVDKEASQPVTIFEQPVLALPGQPRVQKVASAPVSQDLKPNTSRPVPEDGPYLAHPSIKEPNRNGSFSLADWAIANSIMAHQARLSR